MSKVDALDCGQGVAIMAARVFGPDDSPAQVNLCVEHEHDVDTGHRRSSSMLL